jgi:Flp pilus assembly protein CpaB
MKSKNMTLMVVAIGCGLVAAFLTARLSGGSSPEKIEVIVAKRELPVGTLLEEKELENLLGTMKFDKGTLPPDVIVNAEELKGKRLNRTLKQGNYFSATDVAADSGIKIPEGMYKYAIKTDGVKACAGFVQPGDKVDVILTETTNTGRARSGMFLRDMLVLAVDVSQNRREAGQLAVAQVNSVSLAVTSEQSLFLSSAEKRGDVKLVLRDPKNPDHRSVSVKMKIPGIDEEDNGQQFNGPSIKTVSVVFAKGDVPLNTMITKDNFATFFEIREVPEEGLSSKVVKDSNSLWGKYVIRPLEAEMPVFGNWLSHTMADGPSVASNGVPQDLEVLPVPREQLAEKAAYPRRFDQIINGRRVIFVEMSPNEFKRVDNVTDDIKDLPPTKENKENTDPNRAV